MLETMMKVRGRGQEVFIPSSADMSKILRG